MLCFIYNCQRRLRADVGTHLKQLGRWNSVLGNISWSVWQRQVTDFRLVLSRHTAIVVIVLVVIGLISAGLEWRWSKKHNQPYWLTTSLLFFGIAAIILLLALADYARGEG